MRIGFKQSAISTAVFVGILAGLISVDDRVRERFTALLRGGMSPWNNRLSELGEAVMEAARYQSFENAPLVVFAVVSAVLVLFMWRT